MGWDRAAFDATGPWLLLTTLDPPNAWARDVLSQRSAGASGESFTSTAHRSVATWHFFRFLGLAIVSFLWSANTHRARDGGWSRGAIRSGHRAQRLLLNAHHRCALTLLDTDSLTIGSGRTNADCTTLGARQARSSTERASSVAEDSSISAATLERRRSDRNVSRLIDLEDVDSDRRTTNRHGKRSRETNAEHRRCGRGEPPARGLLADDLRMLRPRQRSSCVRRSRCRRPGVGDGEGSARSSAPSLVPVRAVGRSEPSERDQLQHKCGGHRQLVCFGWIGPACLRPLLDDEAGRRLQEEGATDVQQIEGRVGATGHFFRKVLRSGSRSSERSRPLLLR